MWLCLPCFLKFRVDNLCPVNYFGMSRVRLRMCETVHLYIIMTYGYMDNITLHLMLLSVVTIR